MYFTQPWVTLNVTSTWYSTYVISDKSYHNLMPRPTPKLLNKKLTIWDTNTQTPVAYKSSWHFRLDIMYAYCSQQDWLLKGMLLLHIGVEHSPSFAQLFLSSHQRVAWGLGLPQQMHMCCWRFFLILLQHPPGKLSNLQRKNKVIHLWLGWIIIL